MSEHKLLKMYNLNVNVATNLPVGFLGLDGQCNTPRTPEIVNSLVAMTNPFDALMKTGRENNSTGSEESCSGTASPLGSPTNSPPSVQHTRSQLIKEGLKLTIQTKRKQSGSETKEDVEEFESKRAKREELTEEDEERRKRRRERNKIAATKCRMKKREKTANLVHESELLETQNVDLKAQIQDLQKEKRKLIDMLSMHATTCVKHASGNIQNHTFEDLVEGSESFVTGYDGQSGFGSDAVAAAAAAAVVAGEFEIGSTNGQSPMNPYGKDPNFAKLLDDTAATSTNYSRTFERTFGFNNSGATTNYYQTKSRSNSATAAVAMNGGDGKLSENRSCFQYQSDKNSVKEKQSSGRVQQRKIFAYEEKDGGDGFRSNFHCSQDSDDADSYKPNGIIDGNFFANRTDIFGAGNDYVNSFGNSALDNGCMA